MRLLQYFVLVNEISNSFAVSLRSMARNSRRRVPEWLEKGSCIGHFNNHRHKKSLRGPEAKAGIPDLSSYNNFLRSENS